MAEPKPPLDALPTTGPSLRTDVSTAPTVAGRDLTPATTRGTPSSRGSSAPVPLTPATRYEARQVLGVGGMGEVLSSRDALIGRDVAMKVMRRELAAEGEVVERFLREARVQGRLEHPAIVPVYDLGADGEGGLYFTMKRVRGRTLQEVLEAVRTEEPGARKTWSLRKLLTAFVSVCLAVDFAHKRGVLHRDLKPANIMLGDFGEVYVLDWGIARLLPEGEAGSVRSPDVTTEDTERGRLLGTPGYMSPEQCEGRNESLDGRSDVYALGVILFEMLTLERLHQGSSAMDLVARTLEGPAPRASERAPEREVPPELDALCARALALDPAQRPDSARALSDAVESYLDGDRDLALRREASRAHAAAARAAFEAAERGDGEEGAQRSRAMREVTSALGLDASNADAQQVFVQLLTQPPRELPEEARAQLVASEREVQKTANRWGVWTYFSYATLIPFAMYMGVQRWGVFAAMLAFTFLCGVGCWFVAYRPRARANAPWSVTLASNAALALLTTGLGPLFVVPLLCIANMLGLVLAADRSRRVLVVALGCSSFLLPFGLQLAGVLPASYSFEGGAMVIHPGMVNLPPGPTQLFLVVFDTLVVAVTALVCGAFRDALARAEARLTLSAWLLRQIAPATLPRAEA